MTGKQDATAKQDAIPGESLKDAVQNTISSTPEKDAVADGALDDVSGGLWPAVMTGSTYNKTI
ncbi:hypothetical protein N2603_32765 [Bradyrhizobium huanghuaihaiense]|uniref:hypothetical protein n=1 Tax=Bradyrhizobium huanghuaihaiense TaxID=990078 RepID=UPI0021AB0243|nr:hypothetical protein [Bradyrhizobium sp. CB3035]UWU74788.1 hypothetical protein N2603_32765 [Bradyrhizobium sp. CB3035]